MVEVTLNTGPAYEIGRGVSFHVDGIDDETPEQILTVLDKDGKSVARFKWVNVVGVVTVDV